MTEPLLRPPDNHVHRPPHEIHTNAIPPHSDVLRTRWPSRRHARYLLYPPTQSVVAHPSFTLYLRTNLALHTSHAPLRMRGQCVCRSAAATPTHLSSGVARTEKSKAVRAVVSSCARQPRLELGFVVPLPRRPTKSACRLGPSQSVSVAYPSCSVQRCAVARTLLCTRPPRRQSTSHHEARVPSFSALPKLSHAGSTSCGRTERRPSAESILGCVLQLPSRLETRNQRSRHLCVPASRMEARGTWKSAARK